MLSGLVVTAWAYGSGELVSSPATASLCDLGQVTFPLCHSVPPESLLSQYSWETIWGRDGCGFVRLNPGVFPLTPSASPCRYHPYIGKHSLSYRVPCKAAGGASWPVLQPPWTSAVSAQRPSSRVLDVPQKVLGQRNAYISAVLRASARGASIRPAPSASAQPRQQKPAA